jgi:hypothetical protein
MRTSTFRTVSLFALLVAVGRRVDAQTTVTLPIDVLAEVRVRSEFDKLPGASNDLFTYLRSRLGLRITAAPGVRVLMQVQDSRVLGSEGIAAASAADVLDLHQGYLELAHNLNRRQFGVRAGRQEISDGNERLIGVSNWTNQGRTFDGLRLTLSSDTNTKRVKWSVNAIAATIEERGRHFGANTTPANSTNHTLAGIFATHDYARGTTLETTLLYDESGKFRRYSNSDRGTAYGRARTILVLGLHADVEAAYQFGRQTYSATDTSAKLAQAVHAWLLAGRIATPAMSARKVTLSIGTDVLSGDASPNNDTYSAFSTMYASNHSFYGLNDVIGDPSTTTHERGLVDMLATASANISRIVALRAEAHQFTMQAGTNRSLGSELDLNVPIKIGAAASVELGYSAFRTASGATTVGLGPAHATRQWAYLQLRAGI